MVSVIYPTAETESVAITVSTKIVVVSKAPIAPVTLMIPVPESIVIPVRTGSNENRFVPVPRVATKALEVNGVPKVVLIFDPAETTIAESTVMVIILVPVTVNESVDVIVSRYTPGWTVPSREMIPVEGLKVIPALVAPDIDRTRVPVP
jgi:hypothetical protein